MLEYIKNNVAFILLGFYLIALLFFAYTQPTAIYIVFVLLIGALVYAMDPYTRTSQIEAFKKNAFWPFIIAFAVLIIQAISKSHPDYPDLQNICMAISSNLIAGGIVSFHASTGDKNRGIILPIISGLIILVLFFILANGSATKELTLEVSVGLIVGGTVNFFATNVNVNPNGPSN